MRARVAVSALLLLAACCVAACIVCLLLLPLLLPAQHDASLLRGLHARAPPLPRLVDRHVQRHAGLGRDAGVSTTTASFAIHNPTQRGRHVRVVNHAAWDAVDKRDALLVVVAFTDGASWGPRRGVDDLFALFREWTFFAPHQLSVALLTTNMDAFRAVETRLDDLVAGVAQISLLFRNDFTVADTRHDPRDARRRHGEAAQYRNFVLLSTLQTWHEHVLWLDADVHAVPNDLVERMARSGRDVVTPLVVATRTTTAGGFDTRAWAGPHGRRRAEGTHQVRYLHECQAGHRAIVPLDAVGDSLLYVRADVHRQGVLFPHHYAVGSDWETDGRDAIGAEGLCYEAHFLGYTCWGLPHDVAHRHFEVY